MLVLPLPLVVVLVGTFRWRSHIYAPRCGGAVATINAQSLLVGCVLLIGHSRANCSDIRDTGASISAPCILYRRMRCGPSHFPRVPLFAKPVRLKNVCSACK